MTPDPHRWQPGELGQAAHQLLRAQQTEWPTLRQGYDSLTAVRTRDIPFDGFTIRLQFNPRRIVSSAAKVDPKSIAQRRCFLCQPNLPPEQRGLPIGDYLVLANPFPILPEHFTLPHRAHTPQRLADAFPALLDLARAAGHRYTLFYNGPRCGASAPDHLHFQMGTAHFMPIETEYDTVIEQFGRLVADGNSLRAHAVGQQYLRPFIAIESPRREALCRAMQTYLQAAPDFTPADDEPMLNLLAWHRADAWRVILFPRVKHRPASFFAEGDKQILLSPASVDLAGACITPIERDFDRVDATLLTQMFAEVSLTGPGFENLTAHLKRAWAAL